VTPCHGVKNNSSFLWRFEIPGNPQDSRTLLSLSPLLTMDNRESEILPANIPDVAHDDDDAPDVGLSTDVIVNDHNPLQEESDLPLDDPRPSRVFYEHHMIGIAKQ
jgi:hypothetical protein